MKLNIQGWLKKRVVKAGSIILWAGTTAPDGYLICDGSAVSRTLYSDLFNSIGVTYGAGDGATTFNLPNFTNRFPEGNGNSYIAAGLPNISGTVSSNNTTLARATGFFAPNVTNVGVSAMGLAHNAGAAGTLTVSAAYSNAIYGNSTTVQPAACKCLFCIKY